MNRQALIEDNMNLVYFIVHTYYPKLSKDEDVIQSGMLGLCNAANTFEESKSKFSTYATKCICNQINKELHNRKKHYNVLSLDYPVFNEDEETTTFGDLQVGEEDVEFVGCDKFYNQLTPIEKKIFKMRQTGFSGKDISKKLGCSISCIYNHIRKIQSKWRKFNGN